MNDSAEKQPAYASQEFGVRVLVVDHEPMIVEMLNLGLSYEGFEVRIAGDGQQALQIVRESRPQLVILDQMMPGMTGLEAAETILAEQPDQCIILFSAFLDADTHERASAIGIRECLPKKDLSRVPEALWRCGSD